jgi:hypothetical protein
MQAQERSSRPQILYGIGEEGGGQSTYKLKASGWDGLPGCPVNWALFIISFYELAFC